MPRIQLIPAPRYPFVTEIQIYISHVNQGGHLDNAQLLTLVSGARVPAAFRERVSQMVDSPPLSTHNLK